jgi:hypothetical protein
MKNLRPLLLKPFIRSKFYVSVCNFSDMTNSAKLRLVSIQERPLFLAKKAYGDISVYLTKSRRKKDKRLGFPLCCYSRSKDGIKIILS